MDRKKFILQSFLAGSLFPVILNANPFYPITRRDSKYPSIKNIPNFSDDIYIERPESGKPHKGKVLAAIQPTVMIYQYLLEEQWLNLFRRDILVI